MRTVNVTTRCSLSLHLYWSTHGENHCSGWTHENTLNTHKVFILLPMSSVSFKFFSTRKSFATSRCKQLTRCSLLLLSNTNTFRSNRLYQHRLDGRSMPEKHVSLSLVFFLNNLKNYMLLYRLRKWSFFLRLRKPFRIISQVHCHEA